ncbi:class IV adenylate cyclase [Tautonia plasticadhaerens]|uniref:CYTH domain protein n=1 Tax=Tautonia plasticadhaerens TaxID=2527974 RepID=A0A518HCA5_9BACT|nr:class IV adenylate cyclase [Tautonia plasticadhaerens]QDV38492.1 CYTH domain protein [Tautonia plasticadhaerens]
MSPFEVEMKFRGADHAALARLLAELGGQAGEAVEQEDIYLSHPSRDFRETDEALRLRRDGAENRVTYKGPKLAGPTKTREELELTYEAGADSLARMERLFVNLGFRPVATVRKTRIGYRLSFEGRPMQVGLDTVDGLGVFAEVEAIAHGPADLPEAQQYVLELAGRLGLGADQVEVRSYLRLLMERLDRGGAPA